jgi:hypothetical protein
VLGAHVAGTEAAAIVALLVDDGFLKYQIATWLGSHANRRWRSVQVACLVDGEPAGVTVRTTLRLRAIERRVCG